MQSRRDITRVMKKYSKRDRKFVGLLGNMAADVVVTDRTNYVYVRLFGDSHSILEVYNDKVPPIYNLKVILGYNPLSPHLLSVEGVYSGGGTSGGRPSDNTSNASPIPPELLLPAHAKNHTWMHPAGGSDVVYSALRQFMPFRPAANGMEVTVYGTVGYIGDGWVYTSGTSVDLAPFVPGVSGTAQWALVHVNELGNLAFQIGSGSAASIFNLTFNDIPEPIMGTYPVAAVRLRAGQTSIQENRLYSDILDVRFPNWHDHTFLSLRDTPLSYTGSAGKVVAVTTGEGQLEFLAASSALPVPAGTVGNLLEDDGTNWVSQIPGQTHIFARLAAKSWMGF